MLHRLCRSCFRSRISLFLCNRVGHYGVQSPHEVNLMAGEGRQCLVQAGCSVWMKMLRDPRGFSMFVETAFRAQPQDRIGLVSMSSPFQLARFLDLPHLRVGRLVHYCVRRAMHDLGNQIHCGLSKSYVKIRVLIKIGTLRIRSARICLIYIFSRTWAIC